MQDKIQEIMVLVDDIIGCDSAGYQLDCKREIQSKLRELVREPLSDDALQDIFDKHHDDYAYGHINEISILTLAREVERAHNITNTSN